MSYWLTRSPRKTVETVNAEGVVTGIIVGSEERINEEWLNTNSREEGEII
ncbi:hypothetical protein [Rossellomorea sp. DA94]|nr:hypothetical protein [Rossellomorea sp. DA94]WGG47691.1 hypothetical protein P8596_10975 [Rossellomorea sp. DA94]